MASKSSRSSPTGGDEGAPVAGQTHGNLAKDAAAALRARGHSVEGISGVSKEIHEQSASLVEWAWKKQIVLSNSCTEGLYRHDCVTFEHEVFYRKSDDRAVKRTHPGTFGLTPDSEGNQTAATPLFYLRRLELMNLVFQSDLRMEGICMARSMIVGSNDDDVPCIVISQPWIYPADPNRPHPSEDDITEFMEELRFRELPSSFFGWHRVAEGIIVLDARPDNFIASASGVVPIDLVVCQRAIVFA